MSITICELLSIKTTNAENPFLSSPALKFTGRHLFVYPGNSCKGSNVMDIYIFIFYANSTPMY